LFDGRFPDLVEFPRLRGIEGNPSPVGSLDWAGRGWIPAKRAVAPVYDARLVGTTEDRARVLVEDCLRPGLARMFPEVHLTPRGIDGRSAAADLMVLVRPKVGVTIEGRNRRSEIFRRLEDRDRENFALATQMGYPVVVVAPNVTKRYREELGSVTKGLGSVVETGIYVAANPTALRTLKGWAVWPMLLHVPDDVLERIRTDVIAAADRYEAANLGPQMQLIGGAVSTPSETGWGARGTNTGLKSVDRGIGDVVPLVRRSQDELRAEAKAYLADHPEALQGEVADALAVSVRTLSPATRGLWRHGRPPKN
jgi:hypothetical protein